MNEYSKTEEKIVNDLHQSGWQSEDILVHQNVPANGRLAELDLVLLYNLLPIAVVEVKSTKHKLEAATFQVLNYAEMVDVPFGIVSDGKSIIKINRHGKVDNVEKFPSPKDLLEEAGYIWNNKDPILFPAAKKEKMQFRFHQVKAISNAIESLKQHKRTAVILPTGSGKNYVATQVIWKTVRSGFYNRALVLCDRVEASLQLSKMLNKLGEDSFSSASNTSDTLSSDTKVVVINYHQIINNDTKINDGNGFELIVLFGEYNSNLIKSISGLFPNSAILIISSRKVITTHGGGFHIAYQYSLEDAVLAEDVRIPDGYKSIPLEAIADIITGQAVRTSPSKGEQEALALTGRSLTPDGQINFEETRKVFFDKRRNRVKLRPKDILLSTISSNQVKVGLVPESFDEEITISNSLILIRVNQAITKPKDVFEFLKSPSGQSNLIRYASVLSTSINRISPNQLSKMPILIPDIPDKLTVAKPLELSLVSQVKEDIERGILPLLDTLSKDEIQEPEQEPELEYIAERLHSAALKLSPQKLKDKILNQYPMPIAMSYRRFLDSKFNAFEQILRLRDLFESASFFIYNIFLADLLRRLDNNKYNINDAGARRAYNGYSMSKRIDFLGEVLEISRREGNQDDLFVPEFLEIDLVSKLRGMGEFRNLISHTAAATEGRQKRLIEKFTPEVEDILNGMEFITSYRLVRIPEFKFTNGRLIRRMVLYTGVVPELEEFPIPAENELIKAESDHLVLLDQDDQVLDLFPFYQLLSSEETRDETHMCFLKQRKNEQRILTGESVQGSFEVILDGYDVFEELQKKIK